MLTNAIMLRSLQALLLFDAVTTDFGLLCSCATVVWASSRPPHRLLVNCVECYCLERLEYDSMRQSIMLMP